MRRDLARRLKALEERTSPVVVILHFADGSRRELHGRHDFVLQLFDAACRNELTPRQRERVELIARSVASEEQSGHLVQVLRCLLEGPVPEHPTPRADPHENCA